MLQKKNEVPNLARSRTALQSPVIVFSILYIAVFIHTLRFHNGFTRPFRQMYGPASRFSDTNEQMPKIRRTLKSISDESTIDTTTISNEITDPGLITSILLGEVMFPTDTKKQRLRFQPGTLNLTQPTTLQHCFADPAIYQLHYPSSDRQVTSISESHQLIYLMIPKSSSSTGRWIMDNALEAHDMGMNPAGDELVSTAYRDYTVITFVRDPLSRFYSQYDEIFLRYGPWMKHRPGKAWDHVKTFKHPYPYLYENMTEWQDYQDAFCPPDGVPDNLRKKSKEWCSRQPTKENGTLATRFEMFVQDYDGMSPWDLHLHLQVPHISNRHTGRPRRVDEIYNTDTAIHDWKYIVDWYGQSLPEDGRLYARSAPRRFNTSLVSIKTKRRICKLSAIDYCCLNMELPPECSDEKIGVYCSLDQDKQGAFRIQPWFHPHEII